MKINVLYFASLREKMGRAEDTVISQQQKLTAQQIWTLATQKKELPPKILIAINQEYAHATALVKNGDEVAFFPPVTGG